MKFALAEVNGTRIKEMHLKVLELEYSEKKIYLMLIFNELETWLCTIESLLLEFMKPCLWPFGPQKYLLLSHRLQRVPKLCTTPAQNDIFFIMMNLHFPTFSTLVIQVTCFVV